MAVRFGILTPSAGKSVARLQHRPAHRRFNADHPDLTGNVAGNRFRSPYIGDTIAKQCVDASKRIPTFLQGFCKVEI